MYIELYFFKELLSCVGIKNENLSNIFLIWFTNKSRSKDFNSLTSIYYFKLPTISSGFTQASKSSEET